MTTYIVTLTEDDHTHRVQIESRSRLRAAIDAIDKCGLSDDCEWVVEKVRD